MEIKLLGCRGSYPVLYPEIMRYGGDTTCVQIIDGDTLIILDAGTGIRNLDADLAERVSSVHLFISHLHWDHIIGFPRCPLLHDDRSNDLDFHMYSLGRTHDHFYAALLQSVQKPLYDRTLDELLERFQFHELDEEDQIDVGGQFSVQTALANHPYRALGYRISSSEASFGFVPDTAPFDRYLFNDEIVLQDYVLTETERQTLVRRQDALINLVGDVDWLLYDAALTDDEYERLPHWGHSTPRQAADIAQAATAEHLVLFHHNPTRTDTMVDDMLERQRQKTPNLRLSAAYAGMVLGGDA